MPEFQPNIPLDYKEIILYSSMKTVFELPYAHAANNSTNVQATFTEALDHTSDSNQPVVFMCQSSLEKLSHQNSTSNQLRQSSASSNEDDKQEKVQAALEQASNLPIEWLDQSLEPANGTHVAYIMDTSTLNTATLTVDTQYHPDNLAFSSLMDSDSNVLTPSSNGELSSSFLDHLLANCNETATTLDHARVGGVHSTDNLRDNSFGEASNTSKLNYIKDNSTENTASNTDYICDDKETNNHEHVVCSTKGDNDDLHSTNNEDLLARVMEDWDDFKSGFGCGSDTTGSYVANTYYTHEH